MINWKNVEGATKAATDSLGSALKENEKYLNSIQGKLSQFASETQKMWKNTISSDTIKLFVNMGTAVVKLIDNVGLLKIVALGLTIAFGPALLGAFSSLISTISFLTKNFVFFSSTFTGLMANNTESVVLFETALNGLTFLGLSVAIFVVVDAVMSVQRELKRLKEIEDELIPVQESLISAQEAYNKSLSIETISAYIEALKTKNDLLQEEISLIDERNKREAMAFSMPLSVIQGADYERTDALKQQEDIAKTSFRLMEQNLVIEQNVLNINTQVDAIGDSTKAFDDTATAIKEGSDAVDGSMSGLSKLADLWNSVSKNETIAADEMVSLIAKYPSLASQIVKINDLTTDRKTLIKAMFEIEKQGIINNLKAKQKAIVEEIKQEFELAKLKAATGQLTFAELSNVQKSFETALRNVKSIGVAIKAIDAIQVSDKSFATTNTKKTIAKDYKLPAEITQEITRLDNLISASETKSKEEQIKALEVKETYLKKIKTQIKDTDTIIKLDGDIIDIQNKQVNLQKDINDEKVKAIELAQDEADAVLKATREIRDSLNEAGKKVSDLVVAGLEDEKTKLEDAKQARLDIVDLEINAINDQIDAQQKQNDLLQEETDRREKLNAVEIAKSEEKLNLAKILSDLVVAGLEEEKTKLEDAKQARLDTIDLEINAINDQISAQQTKNDLLQEETDRQEKLIAIEKEKQNLANILNERNVKVLRDGKWINVADPSAVSDSQETIKDLETDLATWENDLLKTKQIQALQDTIQGYEDQKTAISTFHDSQTKSIDKTISDINGIEAEGYAERLLALKGFIDGDTIAKAEASTAYSIAVRDSQETIKGLETDLATWENDLLQKKQLQALEDTIQGYEDQKTAISTFYDSQAEIIDASITNINGIEAEGYTDRLIALQGFVTDYNAKVATMLIPSGMTGAGTVSVGSAINTVVSTEMSQADKDAIADASTAYSRATTDAERIAAHNAAEAIRAKYGFSGGTNGTKNILLRDSGGVVPHGSTAMNLSGRPELMINNQDTSKLFNFIKSIPSFVMPKSQPQLAMAGGGGITINGPITVQANNAQEFMISMKNLAILTKR